MSRFQDAFKSVDEKQLIKEQKRSEESYKIAYSVACGCLSSDNFKRYRREYENSQEQMMAVLFKITDVYLAGQIDHQTYISRVLVHVTKMKDLRSLLDGVELDKKRGEKVVAKRTNNK